MILLRFADELSLMARTARGVALISPRRLRLGLAAAMLAELVDCGRLVVHNSPVAEDESWVTVLSEPLRQGRHRTPGTSASGDVRAVPVDDLGYDVLDKMHHNRGHRDVRKWLAYLALTAEEDVGRRLVDRGIVRRKKSLLTGQVRWPPVSPTADAQGPSRLGTGVRRRDLWTEDVVVGGIVLAIGLDKHVFWDTDDEGLQYLRQRVRELNQSYRQIIHHLEAATATAVAVGRT